MEITLNDGGRSESGYKGTAGDCAVRAISIATGKPYKEVYDAINILGSSERKCKGKHKSNSRTGVWRKTVDRYLSQNGWQWFPTMSIGTGCKIHLKKEELPSGNIICRVSKHFVAVIDGVINDTHDCSRNETRCVYGYFKKGVSNEQKF